MPCRSDYMEQTNSEARFQRTAKLLVWLADKLDVPVSSTHVAAADNYYATNVGQVEELCRIIRTYKDDFEAVLMYNLRSSSEARELADWWEEHEAEDRKREGAEAQKAWDDARFKLLTANMSSDDKRILKERLR